MKYRYKRADRLSHFISVIMLVILVVSQTACTSSKKKNSNALVPGSSITPAPSVSTDIK